MFCRAKPVRSHLEFQKTPGWLDWCAAPSKPQFKVPAGSVDAHCHVFGPGGPFPYAPERKYTPCDASKAQLYAFLSCIGDSITGDRRAISAIRIVAPGDARLSVRRVTPITRRVSRSGIGSSVSTPAPSS